MELISVSSDGYFPSVMVRESFKVSWSMSKIFNHFLRLIAIFIGISSLVILKEIKLLEWPTIKIGDEGYYDAPLIISYGYDEEAEEGVDEAITYEAAPSGTMRRIHKELENLIGTTFGSYRFYDD